MRKFLLFFLAFTVASLVWADADQANYNPDATLTLATNADPTFNPWYPGVGVESDLVNELIFSGLTRWGKGGAPEPDLATSWSVSSDGLTWTFKLRQGVKWQDGQPFTADDVAFTFNNIVLNSKLGATNANAYKPVDHVDVVDPHTVKFVLKTPMSSLPAYLAYFEGILPKHIFDGVTDPWKLSSFNKDHPIGTGPFKVEKYVSGSYVRLVRNDDYWGGEPKIKTIVMNVVPEVDTQIAQMLSGNLDFMRVEDPTLLERLKSDSRLEVVPGQENVYFFVIVHTTDPRFQDVRVRQALLYAIDRNAIVKSVLLGHGTVATGPIAPVLSEYYDPNVMQYPYSPDKAKELLKEAGWVPGPNGILQKDGKPFQITIDEGQYGKLVPVALLVQQYWKAIGIDVKMNIMDWNSYLTKTYVKRDYQATVCWWRTPYTADVSPYYASSAVVSGNNWPDYKNPELDKLLASLRAATDQTDVIALSHQIQELLAKQLPYLYLYYPEVIVVKNKKVGGLTGIDLGLAAAFQHAADWYVER